MSDEKTGNDAAIGFVVAGIAFAGMYLCIHFGTVDKVSATIIDKHIQPSEYRTRAGWVIVIKDKDGLPESVYVTEAQYESLSVGQSVNLEASTARVIGGTSYELKK